MNVIPLRPVEDIGCTMHPKSDPARAAQEAWARLRAHQSWADWKVVGLFIAGGRADAMREAMTNRPAGRRYNECFSSWLDANGFSDLEKTTRKRLLQCIENIDVIELWLEKQPPAKRLKLNHPGTVLSAWRRATQPSKEKKKPIPDWLAAWRQTPDAEKTRGLERLSLKDFLAVMPASWRSELLRRQVNLDNGGTPDTKITTILKTALSSVMAANSPGINEIVQKSQERAALAALHGFLRTLAGLDRDLHDVEVTLKNKTAHDIFDEVLRRRSAGRRRA